MHTFNIEIGKGLTLDVIKEKLPDVAIDYAIKRAFKDALQDSHASIKREDYPDGDAGQADWRAASLEVAKKKLAAFYDGDIRANAAAPRASKLDPVEAEALRMARVFVGKATRGWEHGHEKPLAWITKAAEALGIEPHADDADVDARTAWRKDVMARAIKARAARQDVRDAAALAVEAAKSVEATEEDLGL